ncbi:DUF3253 domain-containing protein [Dyadobacter sp.]|uniref:DUF3253 domain-containing protein n=1 Tax=Dyadobacter sp. TaxID=1914288 RepID=UPI0025B9EB1F|nr:DUF3253 domain-containing protein [Dyadobacter sp.]
MAETLSWWRVYIGDSYNFPIAATILSTAIHRGPEKSTCPSEIARMLFPDGWRTI